MSSSIRSSLRKFSTQTHNKIYPDAQGVYTDEAKAPSKSVKSAKIVEWNSSTTTDPDKFKLSEEELKQRRLSRKSLIMNNDCNRRDQTLTPKRHTICFASDSPKSVTSDTTVDTNNSDENCSSNVESPNFDLIRRSRSSSRRSLSDTSTYEVLHCEKSEKFFKSIKQDEEKSQKTKVLTQSQKKQLMQIEQLRRVFEHTPAYMKKLFDRNIPIARPGTSTRSHLITYND